MSKTKPAKPAKDPTPPYLRIIARPIAWLARLFYKVRATGRENLPDGPALILANHISYVDAIILQLVCPRRLRLVGDANFLQAQASQVHWFFRFVYKLSGTIPVSPERALDAARAVTAALEKGEYVLMFPEGAVSRTGQLMEIKRGFELIVQKTGVPIIPAAIHGMWGSIFSFSESRYIIKPPRLMRTHIAVAWGKPILPDQANTTTVRRAILDLSAENFANRPIFQQHIGFLCSRLLARRPWEKKLVDHTADRTVYTSAKLLAASSALSRYIKKTIPETRVGVVLPPGAGATIANLAIIFAGKVPVNLNFTIGRAPLEAAIRIAGIKTILSADAMRERLPNFPWIENTLDFKSVLLAMGGKKAVIPWLLGAYLLPNQIYTAILNPPKKGGDLEAALLFTSGSSGDPKGVALSHKNIITNCRQTASLSIIPPTAILLGCLPVFHSFGLFCTMFPIIGGIRLVTVPSPLETEKIIKATRRDKITVIVLAPTFLRPILKKAKKADFKSVKVIVSGAEKMPIDVHDGFVKNFGLEIMQGYGLTETTPVCALNQPDPAIPSTNVPYQPGNNLGSVGRLFPGMSARIINAETYEELPEDQTGILCLKGANVFNGYLNAPEQTAKSFHNGWFVTGDLAHIDKDGFIFLEGRLSRFSKLAGEMVPHETIEAKINQAFGVDPEGDIANVIIGVSDPAKGEALVLITTLDLNVQNLREKLAPLGIPNLWIPRAIVKTDKIPILGTGKMDIKTCKDLALAHTAHLVHH